MYGSFQHTIDAKGRMFLPSKFRMELGDTVYLSDNTEGGLYVFSEAEWERYINQWAIEGEYTSKAFRLTAAEAVESDVDCQGRILIPQNVREEFSLGKTVMVIGVGKRAEIWDPERFAEYKKSLTGADKQAEMVARKM